MENGENLREKRTGAMHLQEIGEKGIKEDMEIRSRKKERLRLPNLWFAAALVLLFGVCAVYAVMAQKNLDFIPINGTYQNFNPVRRLLDGQIPYQDFNDYLGLGHLLWGSLFTWLWGGNYAASLSAFQFLAVGSSAVVCLVLAAAIFRDKRLGVCFTTILLLSVLLWDAAAVEDPGPLLTFIRKMITTGTSARMLRGAAPAFLVLLLLAGESCVRRFHLFSRLQEKHRARLLAFLCGLCGGVFFTYSNDYGISSWLCFGLMAAVVAFARTGKVHRAILRMLSYFLGSAAGLLVFVAVVTRGHVTNWLKLTFGTGGYQSWYYISGHSFFAYEVDFNFYSLLQAALVVVYIVQIVRHKGDTDSLHRFGIPAAINMTAFCATNEYKLLSGDDLHEMAFLALGVTVLCEALRLVIPAAAKMADAAHRMRIVQGGTLVLALVWIGSSGLSSAIAFSDQRGGSYFPRLGGYMTSLSASILETEQFLDGKTVFSTYASALEADLGQFQPSGYDYIIHVLGDDARKAYMDAFEAGNFDYVTTIRREYSPWEYWVSTANWFFYQELYRNYHPVFSNEYQILWEKNDPNQTFELPASAVKVSLEPVNESVSKIVVTGDESLSGFADIHLKCSTVPEDGWRAKLMYASLINICNTAPQTWVETGRADESCTAVRMSGSESLDQINLPSGSDTTISVELVDGYGEVTLTSKPETATRLEVSDVYCNAVYTVFDNFVIGAEYSQDDPADAVLRIPNTTGNENAVKQAQALLCGTQKVNIQKADFQEDKIYLQLDCDPAWLQEFLDRENCIQLLK